MKKKSLVLVADDDRAVREALASRLVQAGFEVVSAGDPSSAIELFKSRRPTAAILDIQMPGSDGFAVCEYIRKSGSRIPVFFLTGANEGVVRNHLRALTDAVGGNHFVTKPYDGKTLVVMLRRAIEESDSDVTEDTQRLSTVN